jgi:hypothetical protein
MAAYFEEARSVEFVNSRSACVEPRLRKIMAELVNLKRCDG